MNRSPPCTYTFYPSQCAICARTRAWIERMVEYICIYRVYEIRIRRTMILLGTRVNRILESSLEKILFHRLSLYINKILSSSQQTLQTLFLTHTLLLIHVTLLLLSSKIYYSFPRRRNRQSSRSISYVYTKRISSAVSVHVQRTMRDEAGQRIDHRA